MSFTSSGKRTVRTTFACSSAETPAVAFENNELSAEDLEKGERFGIPIALIILLGALRRSRRHLAAVGAGHCCHSPGVGSGGDHRPGLRVDLLRDDDDNNDRACGGDRLFAADRVPIQRRDESRPQYERRGRKGRRYGRPHGAVQWHHRSAGPSRYAHHSCVVLPIARPRGHPGGHFRSRPLPSHSCPPCYRCSAPR